MANATQQQTHANSEQITYWNDIGGPKWVRYQEMLDRQLQAIGNAAINSSKIFVGANVLDVGCGCGSTTLELARRVGISGRALGIDISHPMLEVARTRGREHGVSNASFVEADAQVHTFQPDFDIVFSRFGVMFFEDPVAAFRNLHGALKTRNGRMSFVCWQALHRNAWMSVPMMAAFQHVTMQPPAPDAPGPFAFADAARVTGILESAGFHGVDMTGLDVELAVGGGTDLDDTVDFMLDLGPIGRLVAEAGPEVRSAVARDVKASIAGFASADGVKMSGAVWIATASV